MKELTFEEMEQVDGGYQTGGLPVARVMLEINLTIAPPVGGFSVAASGLSGGMSFIGALGGALLANRWGYQLVSASPF